MPTLPVIPAQGFVELIERFKDLDPANFREFLAIYREEQDRHALIEFNTAYVAMLAEVGKVFKDKTNPLYRSRYASYEAMMDAIEPTKSKYGIGIYFGCESTGNPETMRAYLELFKGLHRRRVCEQDIRISVEGPKGGRPAMNEMQALGSSTTYITKTFLRMAFNLVPSEDTDDDGNAAGDHRGARSTDNKASKPREETAAPNGNLTAEQQKWLDNFQAECDEADSVAEAETILNREGIMNSDERFKGYPKIAAAIKELKQGMIKRIYQGTPDSSVLDEPTPGSHVP